MSFVRFLKFIWEDKIDTMVVFIATLAIALYQFDIAVIASMFIVSSIYALVRFDNNSEIAVSIIISWAALALLISMLIYDKAERTTTSVKSVEYKDYVFTKNKHKMVVNYGNPEEVEVIDLGELKWYQLQEEDCAPVYETTNYTYWTDVNGSKSEIKCKGKE